MKTQYQIPTNEKFLLKESVSQKDRNQKSSGEIDRNNIYEKAVQKNAIKPRVRKMEYRIW